MRVRTMAAMAIVALSLPGCRSVKTGSSRHQSGCVDMDSVAAAVAISERGRVMERDVSLRQLRVVRSAGGDTVVTLTEIRGRSRSDESRRDSVGAAVSVTKDVAVEATEAEERCSRWRDVAWWVWALGGCVIAIVMIRTIKKFV